MSRDNWDVDVSSDDPHSPKPLNFIEQEIEKDLATDRFAGHSFKTRFPPEPNGYLHIGHAKSICLNFGLAKRYGGTCNLRFDDTNPTKENEEYVQSIMQDVQWLGFEWNELHYASDYFEQLYAWAVQLIKADKAYVCDLNGEKIRQMRGTLTEPGTNSPYRDRTAEENIKLLADMRAGIYPDGSRTLRAKIDMKHDNINLRDPVMYRILHAHHHRTGDHWCIYPMYDWAHGESDSIEEITHSICTLEFENHRPLYDWFCNSLNIYKPRQIEFARLNLTYKVLSKRKLLMLVEEKHVEGWNDPRMPTISGMRRRGYTPQSLRSFCEQVGVAKVNSTIDLIVLENAIREDLNTTAPRTMAVLDPIKVVIDNYPADQSEQLEATNNPNRPEDGSRMIPFSKEIYIEREDFMLDPPKKYFRLQIGGEVRLRYAYIIRCESVEQDSDGNVTLIHCTYDPETKSGTATADKRKVKGTIHWVPARESAEVPVRLYDRLFKDEFPEDVPEGQTFLDNLNPDSVTTVTARIEPSLVQVAPGKQIQFERNGYFVADTVDSKPGKPVFNRIVTLRDTWAKIVKKG